MKKLLILSLVCLAGSAQASQSPTVLPTTSPYAGLTMLNNINSAFNTFQSNFSGATEPSDLVTYQWWVDTSTNLLKFYDGSNWLPVARYSGSQWVPISNGVIGIIPSSTGSSNAYVVTYDPAPSALVVGQHYPFIASFQNTGAATLAVNGMTAAPITKNGTVSIASADISSGAVVDTVWDGTDFQMTSQVSNASSGTVTAIATNNGVTGGTITTSGTIGLANQSTGTVLSNISGSSAPPTGNSVSSLFDSSMGSTQGSVLYRSSTTWTVLPPGTNGQVLTTQGTGANPVWAVPSTHGTQLFTSSGSFTAPVGIYTIYLTACGGGGGGGGGYGKGGGGGASGYCIYKYPVSVSPGGSYPITVGGGGSSGPSNTNGGTGGTTYFASIAIPGGTPGNRAGDTGCIGSGTTPGCGGIASDVGFGSNMAGHGNGDKDASYQQGGNGGHEPIGYSGVGATSCYTPSAPSGYAGGGGGGYGPYCNGYGGPGAPGVVIVDY